MKKFRGFQKAYVDWWKGLSLSKKQEFKSYYEKRIYDRNAIRKFPYPNLVYTHDTRISKLTDHQISSIARFNRDESMKEFHT